ncbi:MAG: hypothetical protein H3Z52_05085 [archaeon]|nr:hypothetical protein [archaeon]MCP8320300.1 hypothetical protein [archaeon]
MPNPKFERIVDVFYKNFFSIIVDGKDVAVVLADDGTLYRIKPPKKKHPFRTPDKETEYIYVHCRLERVSLLGVQFWVVN